MEQHIHVSPSLSFKSIKKKNTVSCKYVNNSHTTMLFHSLWQFRMNWEDEEGQFSLPRRLWMPRKLLGPNSLHHSLRRPRSQCWAAQRPDFHRRRRSLLEQGLRPSCRTHTATCPPSPSSPCSLQKCPDPQIRRLYLPLGICEQASLHVSAWCCRKASTKP